MKPCDHIDVLLVRTGGNLDVVIPLEKIPNIEAIVAANEAGFAEPILEVQACKACGASRKVLVSNGMLTLEPWSPPGPLYVRLK